MNLLVADVTLMDKKLVCQRQNDSNMDSANMEATIKEQATAIAELSKRVYKLEQGK